MGIRPGKGSLLEADVEALVNTVNTVGVMGKGVALQFKQAFPDNFNAYERACRANKVQLGRMFVYEVGGLMQPRYIINFPTKEHWRSRSRIEHVVAGLEDLVRVIRELQISSIALPALGCGNGGLNWSEVRSAIESCLRGLDDVDVHLYAPGSAPAERLMPVGTHRPRMTSGRAALIALMDRYLRFSGTVWGVSQIEVQKLMYFLQAAGQPLRLRFEKGRYGPYAENLNHVLTRIEGHFTRGFGDRSRTVDKMEELGLLPGAVDKANLVLDEEPDTGCRIQEVLDLVAGFESPYGLELLSTVHWIASANPEAAADVDRAIAKVRDWSPRKERLFTQDHITVAWQHIHSAPGQWLERSATL